MMRLILLDCGSADGIKGSSKGCVVHTMDGYMPMCRYTPTGTSTPPLCLEERASERGMGVVIAVRGRGFPDAPDPRPRSAESRKDAGFRPQGNIRRRQALSPIHVSHRAFV